MNNHIITKARPQLVRRKMVVTHPKNIVVVVNRQKTATIGQLRQAPPPPIPTPPPPKVNTPPQVNAPAKRQQLALATRQQLLKRRKAKNTPPKVKYLSAEPVPESLGKIGSIRKLGLKRILVIIGNGPSILEAPLEQLRDLPNVDVLTINKPDSRVWPTKYWAFFDHSQFVRHEDLWNSYEGYIFNSTSIKRQKASSMQFRNIGGKGWSRDLLKGLHIGRSSVFASMQIAMWMQYSHVYMFGVDMNPQGIDGKLHFYGQNPDVDPEVRKQRFFKEAEFYDFAADQLTEAERKMFTFCSSYNHHAFVSKFNKMSHRDAVEHIAQHARGLST
jgi:hypothetical protein